MEKIFELFSPQYFLYKQCISVVLMVWVDANYKFVYVDIGANDAATISMYFRVRIWVKLKFPTVVLYQTMKMEMSFCVVAVMIFGLSIKLIERRKDNL